MKSSKKDCVALGEAAALHLWAARVWWSIDPGLFITTILHALVQALMPYVTIWFSAQLINELAGDRDPDALWRWAVLTVAVGGGLSLLTGVLHHWKEAVHSTEWEKEDRLEFKKLMDMDYSAVEDPKTDDLLYALRRHQMGNVYGFVNIHGAFLEHFAGGAASVAGALTLTFSLFSRPVPPGPLDFLNHPVTIAAVAAVLLAGTVLSPVLEEKAAQALNGLWPYANLYNRTLGYVSALGRSRKRSMDVRLYSQQRVIEEKFRQNMTYRKGSPAVGIVRRQHAPLAAAGRVVSVLLTGAVYVFVCLKAWAGAFGVGSVTQYVAAITRMCTGLADLLGIVGNMKFNAALLRDLRQYLEMPNEMYQGSLTTEKRSDRQYDVEFKDVSFKYPRSDVWALRHVNMRFRVGSRVAVVGENGSGKSTFIKLLCRLYDPTEGEILLNGIDIRKYNYKQYMDLFSVVFQDFQLVGLPLGENIAAAGSYDRERVMDCLEKAGFAQRLAEMEKGLDTYLYKELAADGVEVSGGEGQKLAIARALYKDAPFIILDEPTAALDPMAEAEIYSRLNGIVGDKTAVYISHRLSSCKFCDEILVFHRGAVVQQGSHQSLLADESGKYHELWHAQAQYYTEE